MTTGQTKRRAVGLTVLMVLSVLLAAVAFSGASAAANTLVVDANGDQGSYTTIQGAIDDAEKNDTIVVIAGTYDENVTVTTENVTLLGPNAETSGSGDRDDEALVNGQLIVNADEVKVAGFEVSPPSATANSEGEAIRISNTPDNVTVTNNVVTGFDEDGVPEREGVDGIVAFGGDSNDAINNVVITDNKVEHITGPETAGGAAGISIQGNVRNADVTDNVVTGVGENATSWAWGIVVRDTDALVPEDASISENEIRNIHSAPDSPYHGVGFGVEADGTDYEFSNNSVESVDLGSEIKTAADETTVDNNTISDSEIHLLDRTNNVSLSDIRDTNTLEGGVVFVGNHSGDIYEQAIYTTVQDGVNETVPDATVTVLQGTYNESVEIEKGITISGQGKGSTTIDGRIHIQTDGVTVTDLTIASGAPRSDPRFNQIEAIFIGDKSGYADSRGERIRILNVEIRDVIAPETNDLNVDAIHAKYEDTGDTIRGIDLRNVDISNVKPSSRNGAGVRLQGDVRDVDIRSTRIANVTGFYAYGVITTPAPIEGGYPAEVRVSRSTLTNITGNTSYGAGAGVGIDYVNGSYATPSEVQVKFTAFTNNDMDIWNQYSDTNKVQATLNWYGDASAKNATISGPVEYEPFLTAEPENISHDAVQQFGYTLWIQRNGFLSSLSFPGPVKGTVSEVINLKQGETVYAYDAANETWLSGSELADREVDSFNAFLISTTEAEEPIRVTVEYEDTSGVSRLSSMDVEPGWNFIGAPQNAPPSTALNASTGNISGIVHLYGGPRDSPGTPEVFAATATASRPTLNPHAGYWVYMNEGGEIARSVPTGVSAGNVDTLLNWSEWP